MLGKLKERAGTAWEQRPPSMRSRPRPGTPTAAKAVADQQEKAKAAAAASAAKARARQQEDESSPSALLPASDAELRELRARRDRLVERFTIMEADLGGAFYEMAIRDHVRLDVLTRKAAELQRVDEELSKVETELELERTGAAGICNGCGSPFATGTRFCAQCGTPLTSAVAS